MKNSRVLKKVMVIFLLVFFSNVLVFAHPHMWFTSEVEFLFEKYKIKGAFVTWTFDKEFSYDIITGYDLDSNGEFDIREIMDIYDHAFTYTKNYNYFLFIREGKNRRSPKNIAESTFSVHQKNGTPGLKVYYPLEIKIWDF